MSLYSALFSGVSGLSSYSSAMAMVADNITNVNTVGYKGTDAHFSTLVSDGSGASGYAAGGVRANAKQMISKQGLLQASSSSTDLGIDGSGFFVVRGDPTSSTVMFTRAGAFAPDIDGYFKNTAGLYLQGWKLDSLGNYNNNGNLGSLEPIRISDLTGTAQATTKLQMRANLMSSETVVVAPYAAGDMASGAATPQFSRSLVVYDAQGASHNLTLAFQKRGVNQWAAEIYAQPAADVTAPGGLLASGNVLFNPDGSLDLAGSTPALFAPLSVTWTNGAGSSPITLELGSNGGVNGLTQFDSVSAMSASTVNGGLLGNVTAVQISKKGVVSAIFEDGTSRDVYKLPLATFQNPDGLTRQQGNAYTLSGASGSYAINEPGSGGSGMISSNSLEASTVDLAEQFTNMIRWQRAYSASSKIITTADEMLREVSELKR